MPSLLAFYVGGGAKYYDFGITKIEKLGVFELRPNLGHIAKKECIKSKNHTNKKLVCESNSRLARYSSTKIGECMG